ncbi:alpha/beta hydrolase domain-containing protein [Ornithinimicrobium sp. LYQ92]|uniref:alpha/beta hydrolase domain-containing protein n=1 Tax=Serinicoccus sp. LYQ92 TaxID=3378798 RepID=UPI003852D767
MTSTPYALASANVEGPMTDGPHSRAVVLEPYGTERTPTYDYVQEEYFVSGEAAGAPYRTRILVRRPAQVQRANGLVVAEVSHIWGGTSVWRALNRHLMRHGYTWVEIDSQAPSAMDLIAGADPDRYRSMTFTEGPLASDFAATIPYTPDPAPEDLAREYDSFKQRWWEATPQSFEIIAQVSRALRAGLPGLSGWTARRIFLAGISQTGGVVRKFIEEHHQRQSAGGTPAFDGYLPAASGGAALPDIDVPVIELLGEAEFQSVRWSCGVSGQVRGLSHRRPDSDTFRLYEVAGMAHRETRYMSARDEARLADCPLPEGARWSSFPNSHVYAAVLELLAGWSRQVLVPPPSRYLETEGSTDVISRDLHGNALGGLRHPATDVPVSRLVAATPMGRPSWYHGSEQPFAAGQLEELYGSPENYRRQVARSLARLQAEKLYRSEDAEELRLQAESFTW